MSKNKLNKILLDSADAISFNDITSEEYLRSEGFDVESFIGRGLEDINVTGKSSNELTKSQTYFRRLVLAARISHQCHEEMTFGRVKFQKLLYLCEQGSRMNFATHYSKQAAGPFDNKFIHSVSKGFENQNWFSVKKLKSGKYERVQYIPLPDMLNYQQYYEGYYSEVIDQIEHLIKLFKKSRTDNVELVATLYYCWCELIENDEVYSKEALLEKLYNWHKEKKKFTPPKVYSTIDWMLERGIYPS